MNFKLRTIFIVVFAICLSIAFVRRAYREVVPSGAKFLAYVEYSVEAGTISSPDGTTYRVRYNDAGGMHSGNHWTWIVGYHFLSGYYVVDAGYLDIEEVDNFDDLNIEWNDQIPVVPWREGRYE